MRSSIRPRAGIFRQDSGFCRKRQDGFGTYRTVRSKVAIVAVTLGFEFVVSCKTSDTNFSLKGDRPASTSTAEPTSQRSRPAVNTWVDAETNKVWFSTQALVPWSQAEATCPSGSHLIDPEHDYPEFTLHEALARFKKDVRAGNSGLDPAIVTTGLWGSWTKNSQLDPAVYPTNRPWSLHPVSMWVGRQDDPETTFPAICVLQR